MYYKTDEGKWEEVPLPTCPDCGETLSVYVFSNNPYVKCECDKCKTSTTVHTRDMQNRARNETLQMKSFEKF